MSITSNLILELNKNQLKRVLKHFVNLMLISPLLVPTFGQRMVVGEKSKTVDEKQDRGPIYFLRRAPF